jgi:type I restriction enzyme S subunit
LIDEKVDEVDQPERYVGLENIESWTGRHIPSGAEGPGEGASNRFAAGDVLFGKLRPYLAKCFLTSWSGTCTGELLVLRPALFEGRFLQFLMLSPPWIELVNSSTYGAKMPRANWQFIGNARVPVPAMEEQRVIADFLAQETGRIDELIAKKERLIELIEQRWRKEVSFHVCRGMASGMAAPTVNLPYVDKLPRHWQLPPLYARYSVALGKMLDTRQITGAFLMPYLRNIDVQWDAINAEDLPQMDIQPEEYDRYLLRKGDLLVCEGGEVGRCCIWAGALKPCSFQKALHRLRPRRDDECVRYMFYTLAHVANSGYFAASGSPNTIPHLTAEKLRVFRLPKPPRGEQVEIADYLDAECQRLRGLETKIREAVNKLVGYRAALISAAVTGRINVRTYRKEPEAVMEAP